MRVMPSGAGAIAIGVDEDDDDDDDDECVVGPPFTIAVAVAVVVAVDHWCPCPWPWLLYARCVAAASAEGADSFRSMATPSRVAAVSCVLASIMLIFRVYTGVCGCVQHE